MMTVPTIEKTIESIEILHHVKQGNINEASNFLTELQQSNYAWSIADQLLYMKKDLVTSYFGAQTMRNKIQLHFDELPAESHGSLKESLMKHLNNINSSTNSTVSTQLSLALADLFCHMVQWKNGLDEIISTYSQNADSIPVLLDVLKFIPEEFSNRSLRLGVNRKTEIFGELDRQSRSVVDVMEQSLLLNSDLVVIKCFECLNSWFLINLFQDNDLINCRVISCIYDILKSPNVVNESLFKSAVRCATDFFCNDIHTIPRLIEQFQINTYQLESAYQTCAHSRPDYCLDYGKIFCEMASALLPIVLDSPRFDNNASPNDCRTLQMLLLTAGTNRDCCSLVLDVLIDVTDSRDGGYAGHRNGGYTNTGNFSTDQSQCQLAAIFEQLISIMTCHCAVSDNEDEQTLCAFRSDVFFVMEQIRMFVDIEAVFRKMLNDLSQLLINSPSMPLTSENFNKAEAVLCMIGSLVKFVDMNQTENAEWTEQLLTQIILPCIDQSQSSFKDVAFTMFGELCRWACQREPIMDCMIQQMTRFVLESTFDGNSIDELQMSAFNSALQSLAIFAKRQSSQILKPNRWTLIGQLCQRFPQLTFVNKQMVNFYEALGRCLCIPNTIEGIAELGETPETIARKLWELCQINVEVVNQLMRKQSISRVPRDPCDPCVWIDNISALFVSMSRMVSGKSTMHTCNDNSDQSNQSANQILGNGSTNTQTVRQPYLTAHYAVMEQYLWPVLTGLIDHFINDGRVLERVVRILRYSLRCFQTLSKPLLASIAQKIVDAYSHSKESCFLYVGGILVDEFGDDDSCKQGLIQMFHAFSGSAFNVLNGDGLHENPNTTEDLFRLMVRLVQRCCPDFLAWPSLDVNQLFDMAVRSIPGTNLDAKTLALRFLVESFNCANDNKDSHLAVRQRAIGWLEKEGLDYLWQALIYLCRWKSDEITSGDLVEDITDLLIGIKKLTSTDHFLLALDCALNNIGVTRRDGMVYATQSQIQMLRSSMIHDSQVLEGLETFAKLFS